MNIIVIGNPSSIEEFNLKFSALTDKEKNSSSSESFKDPESGDITFSEIIYSNSYEDVNEELLHKKSVIFDFLLDESLENFEFYQNNSNLIIFGNIPKSSLAEIYYFTGGYNPILFGFNGLPGMFNRQYLEITVASQVQQQNLSQICKALGTEFLVVEDRVGMVTPRVAGMIINEAYYTVQEGTAEKEDIDLAMKLGTNYPYGPFEWCQKLGIKNVYELLEAIYEDTKDDRYKICPLLKKEYLLA